MRQENPGGIRNCGDLYEKLKTVQAYPKPIGRGNHGTPVLLDNAPVNFTQLIKLHYY